MNHRTLVGAEARAASHRPAYRLVMERWGWESCAPVPLGFDGDTFVVDAVEAVPVVLPPVWDASGVRIVTSEEADNRYDMDRIKGDLLVALTMHSGVVVDFLVERRLGDSLVGRCVSHGGEVVSEARRSVALADIDTIYVY